jgi:hypothetical protein
MAKRRLKSKALLAAPIVATALFAPACAPRVHRNPGPPQEPRPPETEPETEPDTPETDTPETEPTGTTSPDALPDAPKDGGGKIAKQSDGTCLYNYPPPDMSCPPNRRCNPGPPRAPLRVKCPDGGSP